MTILTDASIEITPDEIRERIKTAKSKKYVRGVIAIRCAPQWSHPEGFTFDGDQVRVQPVISTLDARVKLATRDEVTWLVLLTDISDERLGMGITSHLLWNRVIERQPWLAINAIFKSTATGVDLRTSGTGPHYALDLLRALRPLGAIGETETANTLTREAVFTALAAHYLGIKPDTSDPAYFVAARSAKVEKYQQLEAQANLSPSIIADLRGWLAQHVDAPLRDFYTLCLSEGRGHDFIAYGLVAEIIAACPADSRAVGAFVARVGADLDATTLRTWATTSRRVLRSLATIRKYASDARGQRNRADELVAEVYATDRAHVSSFLPCGFAARTTRFAHALKTALGSAGADGVYPAEPLAEAEAAFAQLNEHELATTDYARTCRVAHDALRLQRWLSLPKPALDSLDAAVAQYRTELGWVDLAFYNVWAGSEDEALGRALEAITEAVDRRRVQFADVFAHHLELATGTNAITNGIERFVPETVIPLATSLRRSRNATDTKKRATACRGVTLIVVDGMSVATAATLGLDMAEKRNVLNTYQQVGRGPGAALAVMPSVTSHSRTSLFSGRITTGGQSHEREGLNALLARYDLKGVLFHRADLESSRGGARLAEPVAKALLDGEIDVVACVLNAVDDALDKTGDLSREWDLSNVTRLRELIDASSAANRTIVLVSDHGHVLERRTSEKFDAKDATSSRWRPADGAPCGPGEKVFRGSRVIGGEAILAVSDKVRYGKKHDGYHGGANPAEMVIPVLVYSQSDQAMNDAGWVSSPPEGPRWWHDSLGAFDTSQTGHGPFVTAAPPPPRGTLFEMDAPAARGGLTPGDILIASDRFKDQYKGQAADTISQDKIVDLVNALWGSPMHRISSTTTAQILGVSAGRLTGAISLLRRVLNYEAYEVLSRDGDVRLDVEMLKDQFELKVP